MDILRGKPLPLGPHPESGGINFAIFAPYADKVELHLFRPGSFDVLERIVLEKPVHTTGSVWHVFVPGKQEGTEYGYIIHAPGIPADIYLLDPYAPAFSGGGTWGDRQNTRRRNLVIGENFAQDARWAGVGKRVMSTPISAMIACAVVRPIPGIATPTPGAWPRAWRRF